jgi:phenylalanyl-tRNA synthetase beta chain
MKFTLSWLKDHLETGATAQEIAAKLSLIGLELEKMEDPAANLAPFSVAYVKEARQHPNADRLRVCIVETTQGEVQVVCGAPNARTGMKGVFAPAGSWIPGTQLLLKAGQIRGEASNGMLVSERELGLSDEHEGIIDVLEDVPVGTPVARLLGLDDPVFDVKITPNHPEALGVRGIARDLAAAGMGRLKPFEPAKVAGSYESPIKWIIAPEAAQHCPYVAGRHFRGVTNGPSPKWLQDRLRAIGLRPISALVDITNYVTFDLNRPLHVFDAAKVKGDVVMRHAREGQSVLALDGRTYALEPSILVIADDRGPEAIAGLMGGEETGCTDATTEVFLEVAYFDPVLTARAGRKLGLHSDARYRFERGLDPQSCVWGVEVAALLIRELCGGETSHPVHAGTLPDPSRTLALRPQRVAALGGLDVPVAEQKKILSDLGFGVRENGGLLEAAVPSWRGDVVGEADLVEEVLRIKGYENIAAATLPRDHYLPEAVLTDTQRRRTQVRQALAARGLEEVVTFSFMDGRLAQHFGGQPESLHLDNPISAELDVMRPSILPNLATAAARNADRGFADAGLFELGAVYRDDTPGGEALTASGLRTGQAVPRHWLAGGRAADAFDAKADVLAVLDVLGAPVENLQVTTDAPAWYHPGRSGALRLGPKVVAWFGELHPNAATAAGLKGAAAAFELFLAEVPQPKQKSKLKPPPALPPFQPLVRDFAFLVDAAVPAEKLIRAARSISKGAADRALIVAVEVFDLYQGEGVPEGKKSIALAVTLQPTQATLTDKEIEAASQKIVAAVAKATGATLRG